MTDQILNNLVTKVDNIADQLEHLAIITANGFESVDKRFESVDKRFEKQDKLMHQLHNQTMDEINKVRVEVKSVEQHLLHRINIVDNKLEQIENMLSQDIRAAYIDIAYLKKEVLDIRSQILESKK